MDAHASLLAALALQLDWGADEALDAVAANRFALPAAAPLAGPPAVEETAATVPRRTVRPAARVASTADAATLAAGCNDLASLLDTYAGFDGCDLRATATRFVRPSGRGGIGLVWIGDAPGEDDDRGGEAASGPDGALLNRLLGSIGLGREDLLVVPIVAWRPPGGRMPSPVECAQCMPFVQRLLVLSGAHTVVLGGGLPARCFLPAAADRRGGKTTLTLPGSARAPAALILPSLSAIREMAPRRREAWAMLRRLHRRLADILPKN